MLGVAFILVGALFLIGGALGATRWIDAQVDRTFFSFAFFSTVVTPILGGGILIVIGLLEFK